MIQQEYADRMFFILKSIQEKTFFPLEYKELLNQMFHELIHFVKTSFIKNEELSTKLSQLQLIYNRLSYDFDVLKKENKELSNIIIVNKNKEDLVPLTPPGLCPTLDDTIYSLNPKPYSLFGTSSFSVSHIINQYRVDKEIIKTPEPNLNYTQTNNECVLDKKEDIMKPVNVIHNLPKNKVDKICKHENVSTNDLKKSKLFNTSISSLHKIMTGVMHVFNNEYIRPEKYDQLFSTEIKNREFERFFIDIIQDSKNKSITLFIRDIRQKENNYIRKFNVFIETFKNKSNNECFKFTYTE